MSEQGRESSPDTLFRQGTEAFDREDWVEAIRSFLAAIQAAPRHPESYLALLDSYEAAADEYGDPELLEQATRVCRDARKLHLDEKQRALLDSTADRIEERLQEMKEDEGE